MQIWWDAHILHLYMQTECGKTYCWNCADEKMYLIFTVLCSFHQGSLFQKCFQERIRRTCDSPEQPICPPPLYSLTISSETWRFTEVQWYLILIQLCFLFIVCLQVDSDVEVRGGRFTASCSVRTSSVSLLWFYLLSSDVLLFTLLSHLCPHFPTSSFIPPPPLQADVREVVKTRWCFLKSLHLVKIPPPPDRLLTAANRRFPTRGSFS